MQPVNRRTTQTPRTPPGDFRRWPIATFYTRPSMNAIAVLMLGECRREGVRNPSATWYLTACGVERTQLRAGDSYTTGEEEFGVFTAFSPCGDARPRLVGKSPAPWSLQEPVIPGNLPQ